MKKLENVILSHELLKLEAFKKWSMDDTIDSIPDNYLVLTNKEADHAWECELDMYIDECILPEIPSNLQKYFDRELWKGDAYADGRGHCIAKYDGEEHSVLVDGYANSQWLYIYRID